MRLRLDGGLKRLTTILVAGRARLRKVEVKKRFSDFFYNASSLNANSVHNIISKQRVKKVKITQKQLSQVCGAKEMYIVRMDSN